MNTNFNDRLLINKAIYFKGDSMNIDADKIIYNSIYFRFYGTKIAGLPKEIGDNLAILRTISFDRHATENRIPVEGVTKYDYAMQFCLSVTEIPKLYVRTFMWATQKYGKWHKANITEVVV